MACVPPEELVGFGALLEYKDPITDVWITVAGTKDLETPEDETPEIDTTNSDNAKDGYSSNIPSPISTLAEVTYTMNFRWSIWKTIQNMKANKTIYDWRIVLMNQQQTYNQFCAWIKKTKVIVPQEELVESELTLMPTGAPTWGELI